VTGNTALQKTLWMSPIYFSDKVTCFVDNLEAVGVISWLVPRF